MVGPAYPLVTAETAFAGNKLDQAGPERQRRPAPRRVGAIAPTQEPLCKLEWLGIGAHGCFPLASTYRWKRARREERRAASRPSLPSGSASDVETASTP